MVTLVVRLVGANLSVLRRAASDAAASGDAGWGNAANPWRGPTSAPLPKAELERRLSHDEGCAGHGRGHLACSAARELGRRYGSEPSTVRALEDTMLRSERPPCVKEAAVQTLAELRTPASSAALLRMAALAERRAEWESKPTDRRLLESVSLAPPAE